MIPTSQTGKIKKLDQATFQAEGWQVVTNSKAIQSVLKAISVNDDDYRKHWGKVWNEPEFSVCFST